MLLFNIIKKLLCIQKIDLNTSNIADPKAIYTAISHLSRSCYTRYGSTIDFYIPANEVDYWVNLAEYKGLNVVS